MDEQIEIAEKEQPFFQRMFFDKTSELFSAADKYWSIKKSRNI